MSVTEALNTLIRRLVASPHSKGGLGKGEPKKHSRTTNAPGALIQPIAEKNYSVVPVLGILPGLGQLYIGQTKKGRLLMLVGIPLCITPLLLIVLPFNIIDTLVLSRRLKRGDAIAEWEWFWHAKTKSKEVSWEISAIIKQGRAERHIGVERRLIDNSKGSGQIIRNVTIRREYTYTYTVEYTHSQKTINAKNINARGSAKIEHSIEKALQKRYLYAANKMHIHEENIQIIVEPFKKVELILSWKNILEIGIIVLQNQYGEEKMEFPFSIVVGLTFDQVQLDI